MPEVKLTKKEIIDLIKSIDPKAEFSSEKEDRRKWFTFGAYDVLRTLTEKVKDYEPQELKVDITNERK